MFVRLLTVHCDQNNSYEITINGFQVRKINEIRNVIFGLRYGIPSSALRPKLGCSPSWVLDEIQIFLGKPSLNNKDSWPRLFQRKIQRNLKIPFFLLPDRIDLIVESRNSIEVGKWFIWSNLCHESLLFKQGFLQNIWISSSTQLGEHPNFGLNAEEGFP